MLAEQRHEQYSIADLYIMQSALKG